MRLVYRQMWSYTPPLAVTLRVLSPRVCVCNVYVRWSLPYVTTGSSSWRKPQFERNVQNVNNINMEAWPKDVITHVAT